MSRKDLELMAMNENIPLYLLKNSSTMGGQKKLREAMLKDYLQRAGTPQLLKKRGGSRGSTSRVYEGFEEDLPRYTPRMGRSMTPQQYYSQLQPKGEIELGGEIGGSKLNDFINELKGDYNKAIKKLTPVKNVLANIPDPSGFSKVSSMVLDNLGAGQYNEKMEMKIQKLMEKFDLSREEAIMLIQDFMEKQNKKGGMTYKGRGRKPKNMKGGKLPDWMKNIAGIAETAVGRALNPKGSQHTLSDLTPSGMFIDTVQNLERKGLKALGRKIGLGKKRKSNMAAKRRGQMISKIMKEQGVSLGEASKMLKQMNS